ncbi:MAG: SPOR domain-containing protein [Treponema sp.]|nr:SPOR domain-containing protein [Treponema sp.]
MEKKKLLLVTISVGVFLVVVIGASILVFSPRNPAPAVAAYPAQRPIPAGVPGTLDSAASPEIAGSLVSGTAGSSGLTVPATADPANMVRNSSDYEALQISPAQSSMIQENRFYINSDGAEPLLIERHEGDAKVIINVARPSSAAVPDAPSPPKISTPQTVRQKTAAKTSGTAAVGKTAVKIPAAVVKPAVRQQQSKTFNAYWVQTGSFPTKNQADKARDILAAKGLNTVIENGDVKGEIWYRVRIGPYTSQSEADYWLSLVKSIDGKPYIDLTSSIVWQSYARP